MRGYRKAHFVELDGRPFPKTKNLRNMELFVSATSNSIFLSETVTGTLNAMVVAKSQRIPRIS